MTPSARLSAVIELYDFMTEEAKPADQVMHLYFRDRKFMGSKDRRFIAETIYTLLRCFGRLQWWVKRAGLRNDGRTALLLWLAISEKNPIEDIEEFFDGEGYGPHPLSQDEYEVLENSVDLDFEPAEMPEAIKYECPDWAFDGLKKQFGDDFAAEMLAIQEGAMLDLRVNSLKDTQENVFRELRKDEFEIMRTPLSPLGLRVRGRPPFSAHPMYLQGHIEVQDEGSQILSLLCGVKAGEWVVDFCAGAGGKTLALAAQLENKGRIWACDVEESRLENSRKRLRRSGVHCVELKLLDDEKDDWVKKHKGKADCVLIDAPCSGVGTWRRNPYSRWQNLGPNLADLTDLQTRIFQSAARLAKPGGRVIYATCSLLPEENQDQVAKFLENNPGFEPIPLSELWMVSGYEIPAGLDLSGSSLQLTTAKHKTDGFFVSALRKL